MIGIDMRRRVLRATIGLACVLAAGMSSAGGMKVDSYGKGDHHKGKLRMSLYRGVAVPYELTVIPTRKCDGEMQLDFDWDEEENEVHVRLRGDGVLDPYPSVRREEGVSYFPNPFWPEKKDFDNGRYQLWLLASAKPITLYYDPQTLDFIGSEYDFDSPPSPVSIVVPSAAAVPMPFFQPSRNGDVDKHWVIPYDRIGRQDDPTRWGHHYFTLAPTNLCLANPYRIDQTTARPYLTKPLPPDKALGFEHYIQSGLFIDLTVDAGEYPTMPPKTTMVASYSGAVAFGGSVPKGWQMDLNRIFGNLAPAIVPWPGRDRCAPWTYVRTNPVVNFCQQMGQSTLLQRIEEHNATMLAGHEGVAQ